MTIAGKSNYTFLNADNLILARSLPVKIRIKGSNPKTFMDNISFRFDPEQKKIVNLSFTLTKKAEDDIFNAARSEIVFVSTISIFLINPMSQISFDNFI